MQKLIADFQAAVNDYYGKLGAAKTDDERAKIAATGPPRCGPVAARLIELSEMNPADKAVNPTALLWIVARGGPEPEMRDAKDKAFALLTRDYADDPQVGYMCLVLTREPSAAVEKFLRAVRDADGPHALKGQGSLALGEYWKNTETWVRRLRQEPDLAKSVSPKWGRGMVDRLAADDPDRFHADAEKALEEAADKFDDVRVGRATVAELARADLFEMRNLQVGKVAPDIEGEDLDGKAFKLSDYRGKVVVVEFWGNWVIASQAEYAQERSLVKRMESKPFALLGVNSDADKDALKKLVEKIEINWRSWWNGPDGFEGPLSKKWNIHTWPTTYVLDAKGVIRYKNVRGDKLDEAVDALVKELESGAK
jgi:peroxiredoxin